MRAAIGVDIGGTNLRAARISVDGRILARDRCPSSSDPETVLASAAGLIAGLLTPDVVAIGIGVPGAVDFPARRVLWGGFVNFAGLALAERIELAFGLPVVLDNDCSMALLAEAALGAAKGLGSALMLTIGTGIGGAVLEGGRLVRGRATAGQLGHVTVDPGGPVCVCGRRGCVEVYSSGTALQGHIAAAGLAAGTTADDLLGRDDAVALGVLAAWAGPLRVAVETLAVAFDPGLVVLGGGLGAAAVRALARVPGVPSWFGVRLAAAALGDDAGVIGAGLAGLASVPAAAGRRAVLVNGVPASGKSSLARDLAAATGWPLLALDTIKEPFLQHLGGADRAGNRVLGRAAYQAVFASVRDFPAGSTVIVDAWFGFEPEEVLAGHLALAGISQVAEVWCHAPPEEVGRRYAARLGDRLPGHPGAEYVPELVALAGRARPLDIGALREVETVGAVDLAGIVGWLRGVLG